MPQPEVTVPRLVSLDGNRHWVVVEGGHQRFRAGGHIGVTGDAALWDGGGVAAAAGAVAAPVWVRRLGGNTGALVAGKNFIHDTAIATATANDRK